MLGSFMNSGCLWVTDMKPEERDADVRLKQTFTNTSDISLMSYNQLMSQNINVVFCTRNLVHLVWVKKRHFKRFIWRKRTHGVSFLYRFGHFLLFSSTQACRIKRGHESLYPHNTAHTTIHSSCDSLTCDVSAINPARVRWDELWEQLWRQTRGDGQWGSCCAECFCPASESRCEWRSDSPLQWLVVNY